MEPATIAAIASIAGGALSSLSGRTAAKREQATQREFAQMGLQWKAADARAAGLHPLAVLGATGANYTPVMVGDTMGPALAQAGQDYARAMERTQTQPQRDEAGMARLLQQIEARESAREDATRRYNLDMAEEARRAQEHQRRMDVLELQHRQLLDSTSRREPGNPPFPSDTDLYGPFSTTDHHRFRPGSSAGMSPDPRIKRQPAEVTVPDRDQPHREAGPYPGFKRYQTSPVTTRDMPAFQTDSELTALFRELRAYMDKWQWEHQGSRMYRQVPSPRAGNFAPRLLPPN